MAPCALRVLSRHAWPGNVRELRNVVLRLEAECPRGRIEGLDVVFDTPVNGVPTLSGLEAQTAAAVHAELARHRGNIRQTAQALGCSRTTVYRYLDLLPTT
jgi:transcriptional regulator of acetoin/glycerol metabolism